MLQAKKYTTEHLQHLKNKVSNLYQKKSIVPQIGTKKLSNLTTAFLQSG